MGGRPRRWGRAKACWGRALTIPAALARSGLLGAKLPLWLVDTVLGFLLLSPMASMDWLRLRMTRCEGGVGVEEAQTLGGPPFPGKSRSPDIWSLPTNATLGNPRKSLSVRPQEGQVHMVPKGSLGLGSATNLLGDIGQATAPL